MTGARGQAECTGRTAPTTVDIPAPSAPRAPTFLTGLTYEAGHGWPVDMTGARGQAECTAVTAPTTVDIPAPSAPRTPTFLTGLT